MAVIAFGLSLTGCDVFDAPPGGVRAGTPAATDTGSDFVHSQTEDISGYYRPAGVTAGDGVVLNQVFIAQAQDFESWEKGERSRAFGPVMMEFMRDGETLRVLPDRYAVSDNRVSMRGTVAGFGEVSFDARLDKGALATARRNLGGAGAPAMTGSVRIGRQSVSGVKFAWYGGD